MPGRGHTDARKFVDAMQRINAATLNGWFFISFIAALVFTTGGISVSLNELVAAGSPARFTDLDVVHERFEATSVRWNIGRAVASAAAFGSLTWAWCCTGALCRASPAGRTPKARRVWAVMQSRSERGPLLIISGEKDHTALAFVKRFT